MNRNLYLMWKNNWYWRLDHSKQNLQQFTYRVFFQSELDSKFGMIVLETPKVRCLLSLLLSADNGRQGVNVIKGVAVLFTTWSSQLGIVPDSIDFFNIPVLLLHFSYRFLHDSFNGRIWEIASFKSSVFISTFL